MLHKKQKKVDVQQEDFQLKFIEVANFTSKQKSKPPQIPHYFTDLSLIDLLKLYNHKCMDPDGDPQTLQNKVQWDLCFYFARRANENFDKFTKGTFKVKKHEESGLHYIVKRFDEQTKNYQMDSIRY